VIILAKGAASIRIKSICHRASTCNRKHPPPNQNQNLTTYFTSKPNQRKRPHSKPNQNHGHEKRHKQSQKNSPHRAFQTLLIDPYNSDNGDDRRDWKPQVALLDIL